MGKLRFRYANGSPKQRKFEGGHEFAKRRFLDNLSSARNRPHKFREYRIGASVRFLLDGASREVRIFEHEMDSGGSRQARAMWHTVCADFKTMAKAADPDSYRKTLSSSKRRRSRLR